MNRYVLFAIIVVVSVVADIGTKLWAENNLASRSTRWEHPIELVVTDAQDGLILEEWIEEQFGIDPDDETRAGNVHSIYQRLEGDTLNGPLPQHFEVDAGDELVVHHRQMTVVPGFWNHVYVQNFGAAWGMFSEKNESFRRPFFLIVSIVAVLVVFSLYRGLREDQRMMQVALSLIVGGALGNFIDRVRYGYVVDFIDWYITTGGQEKHWPTFNIADVWITIGVVLMAIQILFFDGLEPNEEADDDASTDDAAADAASA